MRSKACQLLSAGLILFFLARSIGLTGGSSVDSEISAGDVFASQTATPWIQTTQEDFEAGVTSDVDTISSSGNVTLADNCSSGFIASVVLDTQIEAARWDGLLWDCRLPESTSVTFAVRASDTLFHKQDTDPSWTTLGSVSPVISGLPTGRYKQWKTTLSTADADETPVLSEVRAYFH